MGNTDSGNTNINTASLQTSDISENTSNNSYSLLSFSCDKPIQYKFTWNSGGNNVLLTGDFVEWNKYFEMSKDNSSPNTFTLILPVPRKPIQFKFIVDNEWKYSEQYPLITDPNHNINNHLDLTNTTSFPIPEHNNTKSNINSIKDKDKECSDDNISEAETEHSSRKTSIETNRSSNVSSKDIEGYTNEIPLQQSLSKKAPRVPIYYKNPFDLMKYNSQSSDGSNRYISTQNTNSLLINCNCSFNILNNPVSHINLNHLIFENKQHCKNYIRCGITRRIRFKEVSIIYYKPNNGNRSQQ